MEIDTPEIDIRLAVDELANAVSEFNRLAVFLTTEGYLVQAEILVQDMPNGLPPRPLLGINVVAPL